MDLTRLLQNDTLLRAYFVERRRSLLTQADALQQQQQAVVQQRRAVLAEVSVITSYLSTVQATSNDVFSAAQAPLVAPAQAPLVGTGSEKGA